MPDEVHEPNEMYGDVTMLWQDYELCKAYLCLWNEVLLFNPRAIVEDL